MGTPPPRVPEAFQGSRGKSHKKGHPGLGELCERGILPCSVFFFFVRVKNGYPPSAPSQNIHNQGCRKLFRAGDGEGEGGANRGIQAPEANRGQWGWIGRKRHFAMFCCYNSLSGIRATWAVAYSGPAVLHPWLNLSILIEEIPTLLTTCERIYGRAHAGTPPACRNGCCLDFTALG